MYYNYVSQQVRATSEQEEAMEAPKILVELVDQVTMLIFGGDVNAHLGRREAGEEDLMGKFNVGEMTEGRGLMETCKDLNNTSESS